MAYICSLALIPSQHELRVKFLNGLPYFLTLRNEYVPKGLAVAFTHSWSLSVEEKFYFVWPILFFIMLPKLKGRWAIVPITIVPLFVSPTSSIPVAYFSLLLGCCVAIALHALRGNAGRSADLLLNRIPMIVAVIVWILSYFASLGGTFRVSFILSTAALLPVLLLRESLFSRILGSRICSYVGKRTYSMYLFHAFCLAIFEDKVIHPTTVARYFTVVVLTYSVKPRCGVCRLCGSREAHCGMGKEPCHGVYRTAAAEGARKKPGDGTRSPDLATTAMSFVEPRCWWLLTADKIRVYLGEPSPKFRARNIIFHRMERHVTPLQDFLR